MLIDINIKRYIYLHPVDLSTAECEVRVKNTQQREHLDTPYSHRTYNKKQHKTSHVHVYVTHITHTQE